MIKRILVSGGWGYGNIGDDAILDATKRLLDRFAPNSSARWMSYDVDLTRQSGIALTGEIGYSLHRQMDYGEAFHFLQTVGKTIPTALWHKVPRRLCERLVKPVYTSITSMFDRKRVNEDWFDWADTFIMSGGGYFNSWSTMFKARIKEIEIAREHGCKVLLIGQSFGPFTDEQKEILSRTLNKGEVIVARDTESTTELLELGAVANLMPDLAMGFGTEASITDGLITVVPAELTVVQEKLLVKHITECVRNGLFSKIRIVITRLIYPDVATSLRMKKLLEGNDAQVELRIPSNYQELVDSMSGAEVVASRGLHAMILGWRSGSKVLALTKSRKVDGFLTAIGCPANQTAKNDWSDLMKKLLGVKQNACDNKHRDLIAHQVETSFCEAFRNVNLK